MSQQPTGGAVVNRIALLLGLVLSLQAITASAQLANAEQAIRHRRAAFTLMSTYFSRMNTFITGERPFDRAVLVENAKVAQFLSALPWEGFIAGSERGDTRAEPDIWLDEEQFRQLASNMQTEVGKLPSAAATDEIAGFKTAYDRARATCQACHEKFRSD